MINGMPVNDMENGWVYWSNWDGLGDASSSIQMQRGLSAINLATPSIGGTMNIITDPTAQASRLYFKQEFGTGTLRKSTFGAHTGLLESGFAFSATVVRKTGNGQIDGTWTDAWAYYLSGVYNVSEKHRLELYALGAPQRHGQNIYKQNIAVYDAKYAKSLKDYDTEAFEQYNTAGRLFNQNWAPVSKSYKGRQNFNEANHERWDPNFIMERENFFHKPLVNLNWYAQFSKKWSQYTVLYYSGGHGGGTGTIGDLVRNSWQGPYNQRESKFYYSPPNGYPWIWNWDATIAINRDSTLAYIDKARYEKEKGQSLGVLRNSRNNQWQIGAISKALIKVTDNLSTQLGLDWRTAEIEHYREVRDLLGGQYFDPSHPGVNEPYSDFWTESEMQRHLGDKIDYNFDNTVDWIGLFAQSEYTSGPVTAYGMVGWSTIKYSYVNHFRAADTTDAGEPDPTSGELKANSDWINGLQVKGGASYRLSDNLSIYGNAGYVSKVPIFDNVIDDRSGVKNEDFENETFMSGELGAEYTTSDRKVNVKANAYYTIRENRTYRYEDYELESGEEINIFMTGVDQTHYGVEAEAAWQPLDMLRFDAAASIGNWTYTKDVPGESRIPGKPITEKYKFYIKNLKVGDAPQTQLALAGTYIPVQGLPIQLVWRHYRDHYSFFNPFSRTDPDDRKQSWKTPDYHVFDLHVGYDLPFNWSGVKFRVFMHVFNILDETYIQDSVDNSEYSSWDDDHDADDAEVFLGLPRFFNVGFSITY
jgi:hypothetical protein